MKVWVLQYASGYTSEATVELFLNEVDCRNKFIEDVKNSYDNEELSLDDVLFYINTNEAPYSGDDVDVDNTSVSWDGVEVYESLCYYEMDVK